MVGKTLFFNLIWRVALLIITSIAIIFMAIRMLDRESVFTLLTGTLLLIVQIYLLTRYILSINKTLISFIDTVGSSSATELKFHAKSTDFQSLESRLNQLKLDVSTSRFEEQKHKSLLDIVVSAMDTGLICINQEQVVVFSNKAADSMLLNKPINHFTELDTFNPSLAKDLKNLQSGTSKTISLPHFKASVGCKKFIVDKQEYSLFSIQDIQREIDAQEIESWQKLIRVLTHEIMNSMGPILSLSKSLKNSAGQPEDLVSGLSAIEKTGEGLLHFIKEYRKLTSLPPPEKNTFPLSDIASQMQYLFSEECAKNRIQFKVNIKNPGLKLFADQHQIEQILINLIKNALDSLKASSNGIIEIRAFKQSEKVYIEVEDNGPGINEELKDQIFVPFFTTKNNGSGIGLSLSRQIMNNHDGSIKFSSIPNKETVFTLRF
jgi:nitrogen fixation/metabolism regulation signal transduction histidine kinase